MAVDVDDEDVDRLEFVVANFLLDERLLLIVGLELEVDAYVSDVDKSEKRIENMSFREFIRAKKRRTRG